MSLLTLLQSQGAAVPTFAGTWEQPPATWATTLDTPVTDEGHGPVGLSWRRRRRRAEPKPEPIPEVVLAASFVQEPASWRAELDTYDAEVLFFLFDEPALIGAR